MPFIPDNSVPALKKQDRYKILLDNARKQEVITRQEATRAKKDSGFAETIVRLTGMGKTADTFAKYGANKMSSPEAKQFAPMPSKGEMAGAIGQTALMAFPGQTVAKGVTGVASKFMGAGASKLAGSVASLGGAGYGFDVSQNLQEGKTGMSAAKPGFGAALGAIPLVGAGVSKAKSGIQKIGAEQAPRIINSLIKPLQKDFAYGKNPGRAVAGIKADNFDDLVTKISQSRQKAGQEIGDLGKKLEGKVVLNLQDTLLPINDAMETAAKQNNATLLQRLASVKRSITENLKKGLDEAGNPTIVSDGLRNLETATFKEARDIMRAIGDVTAFTGNPSDDKLVNSALKRVYGQMKGKTLEAAEKADPAIAKMFRKATERYGDLTSAEIAAKYRDKILERQNITSFGQTTVGLGGALATAIATGGAAVPTILAGLGAAGLQKALGSTAFKTRLAAWLVKIPAGEKATILQKFPQLQQIINTRTPGDVFLDSKIGGKVKQGVSSMKGKGGLSIQAVGSKSDDPLLQEARKYGSAEEFVKAQGKTYYHATDKNFDDFNPSMNPDDVGTWFAGNKANVLDPEVAKTLPIVKEQVVKPGTKLITEEQLSRFEKTPFVLNSRKPIHELLMEKGYRGIRYAGDDIQLFEPNVDTIAKSKLTDLWKKANQSSPDQYLLNEARKYKSAEHFIYGDEIGLAKKGNQYENVRPLVKQVVDPSSFGSPLGKDGDIISTQSIDEAQVQKYMKIIEEKIAGKKLNELPIVILEKRAGGKTAILDGHNRAEAYRRYGYAGPEGVPVIWRDQLTDLWKKAQGETERGFGTGAGRPKTITKAQDSKITKSSLQEVLQDGAREYIKILEKAKTIDFDAVQRYQDLLKRAPKITDIQSLTRNIAELERKSKLKLMDEAIKIRDEVFDGLRKKNLKK